MDVAREARERRLVDEPGEAPQQREARGQERGRQQAARQHEPLPLARCSRLLPPSALNLVARTAPCPAAVGRRLVPSSGVGGRGRRGRAGAGGVGEVSSAARCERRRDGLQRGPQRRRARRAAVARARRLGAPLGGRARRRRLDATARARCCAPRTRAIRASGSSCSSATSASTRRWPPGMLHARAGIVVTMDGDLQNDPDDIGKLVAALEDNGVEVASGRRQARADALMSRKLPSRAINGMLRKLTNVEISRLRLRVQRLPAQRDRAGPAPHRPPEVHEGADPLDRRLRRRGRPQAPRARGPARRATRRMRLVRLALHVLFGFWPQPIQWAGAVIAVVMTLASLRLDDVRRRSSGSLRQTSRA